MFTGIVQRIGEVRSNAAGRLEVEAGDLTARLSPGASLAVNGCCLTVIEMRDGAVLAEVIPETLARTNVGDLSAGDRVNLELAASLSTALDGHLVQGHIDRAVAVTERLDLPPGQGSLISFDLPSKLAALVTEKGSVAVDGASLTVAGIDEGAGTFTVAFIPHTLATTIASGYAPGRRVNLEVDLIARYLRRLLGRDRD